LHPLPTFGATEGVGEWERRRQNPPLAFEGTEGVGEW
jgi:hypothetical protein